MIRKKKVKNILDTIFGWLGSLLQPAFAFSSSSSKFKPASSVSSFRLLLAVVVVVCVPFHPELIEISGTGQEPEKFFFF